MNNEQRTRRQWLALCAGASAGTAAIAGCTGGDDDDGGGDDATADETGAASESQGDYGAWPMERYNAQNRLSVPNDGLDGEPELLWRVDFDESRAPTPPVVYDDTAYVSTIGDDVTRHYAIDLADGDVRWTYETGREQLGFATPAVSDVGLIVEGDGPEAIDHETGDVRWTTDYTEILNVIRIYDNLVYAGLETEVVALSEDGKQQLSIDVAPEVQSLAIDEDHVYVRSRPDPDEDEFVIAGYDRASGDQQWEHEISHAEQWAHDRYTRTTPVIDGTVYTVTDDAIISIDGGTGDVEEIVDLDRSAWTRPTIHDGVAHIERRRRAFDLESGTVPDQWEGDEFAHTPPVFAGDVGYALGSAGTLEPGTIMEIDSETGELNWEVQTEELGRTHFYVVLNGLILISKRADEGDDFLVAYGT